MSSLDRHTVTLTHRRATTGRRLLWTGIGILSAALLARAIVHGWLVDPGPSPPKPPMCTDIDVITSECDALLPETLRGLPPIAAAAAHATREKFAHLRLDPDTKAPREGLVPDLPLLPGLGDIAFDDYDLLLKTTGQDIDPEDTSYQPWPPDQPIPVEAPDGVDPTSWMMWRIFLNQMRSSDAIGDFYRQQYRAQERARGLVLIGTWNRAQVDWERRHERWEGAVTKHAIGTQVATVFPFGAGLGALFALIGAGVLLNVRRELIITPHRLELGEHTILLHDVRSADLVDGELQLRMDHGTWSSAPYLLAAGDRDDTLHRLTDAVEGAADSEDASEALNAMQALRENEP